MTDIQPGQTWRPSRPGSRAKARHIVWVGEVPQTWGLGWKPSYPTIGWAHDPLSVEFPKTGHDSWLAIDVFKRWAKKHDARPA
jgi:hypothetical protein